MSWKDSVLNVLCLVFIPTSFRFRSLNRIERGLGFLSIFRMPRKRLLATRWGAAAGERAAGVGIERVLAALERSWRGFLFDPPIFWLGWEFLFDSLYILTRLGNYCLAPSILWFCIVENFCLIPLYSGWTGNFCLTPSILLSRLGIFVWSPILWFGWKFLFDPPIFWLGWGIFVWLPLYSGSVQ